MKGNSKVIAALNTSRELVEAILEEEEAHVDLEEARLDQIGQMGIQTFLSEQTRE